MHHSTRDEPRSSSTDRVFISAVGITLLAYLLVTYHQALALPFLNDDYVFLDKVGASSFIDLWKPERLFFDWYRPWSRELHYWTLYKLAGLKEPVYHVGSFGLWLAVMLLNFSLAQRLVGSVIAATIATAGLATLSLWSAPLLWIAGAQDLWMLLFALLVLHGVVRGWNAFALGAFVLALLSKETAAVLPGIALALVLLIRRRSLRQAIRETSGLWIVLFGWMLIHPTLSSRMLGPLQNSLESQHRPTVAVTAAKTLLAQINLDGVTAPGAAWPEILLKAGVSSLLLCLVIFLAFRRESADAVPPTPATEQRAVVFGLVWAVLGWGILFLPSIGWHAYYGSLGTLGCWLAIGTILRPHRRTALALIVVLSIVREARTSTLSWDWGTYWYQKRAGSLLGAIRDKLFQFHPSLPARSRLFFARLPNNIGLLAGDGPAIRIWYQDPTLQARYYSAYSPRAAADSIGGDYFFRFDTLAVLVEVQAGSESTARAERRNETWRRDQQVLATLFMQAGNLAGAARSYEKLWMTFPESPNYALYAATTYEALGDSASAAGYYRVASRELGDSLVHAATPRLVREAQSHLVQ